MNKFMKKAFITGITGQDGSYLTELLLDKHYEVHGLIQKSVTPATSHFQKLSLDERYDINKVMLHYGDITDYRSLLKIIKQIQPDEVYHLAAQSDIQISFENPLETADINALGSLRVFAAIHNSKCNAKIFNASSRELYGSAPSEYPQNEKTPFHPESPYAIAKLFAYHCAIFYRNKYGLKIWNGILYNHESPRRGENFVTRKITHGIARIMTGKQKELVLGNLNAMRDWGYAPDYVEAMWLMLQSKNPDDFIIATSEMHSVQEFLDEAMTCAGVRVPVKVSKNFLRISDVNHLCGDYHKAKKILGWKPKTTFKKLVRIMMEADMKREGL